jgi:4-hydroxyphenylpyruvate dioxygenase-like putative hemolysin
MNIDHIAHAVPNIDEAIVAYKKSFNVPISEVMIVEKQNIKMAIISFENLKIELMEPLNDKSPISKFLEKSKRRSSSLLYIR